MNTDTLNKLLVVLSRRKDPKSTWWYTSNTWHATCHICSKNFDLNWDAIKNHGMIHLKQSNLISFI